MEVLLNRMTDFGQPNQDGHEFRPPRWSMINRDKSNYFLTRPTRRILVLAAFFVCCLPGPTSNAQSVPGTRPVPAGPPTRYSANRFPGRAAAFYGAVWGVDSLSVKAVESGELIRFSYRILDANKARTLNDKAVNAFLIAPRAGLRLSVPSLEKVGQLRQSSTPEAGRLYWMAFSNPGRRVKRGERVNVVIGNFQAEGLVVD
jgi:hypothetical protein